MILNLGRLDNCTLNLGVFDMGTYREREYERKFTCQKLQNSKIHVPKLKFQNMLIIGLLVAKPDEGLPSR